MVLLLYNRSEKALIWACLKSRGTAGSGSWKEPRCVCLEESRSTGLMAGKRYIKNSACLQKEWVRNVAEERVEGEVQGTGSNCYYRPRGYVEKVLQQNYCLCESRDRGDAHFLPFE